MFITHHNDRTRLDFLSCGGAVLGAVMVAPPPEPPPQMNPLALKTPGEFDALAAEAGFGAPASSMSSKYPFDMGSDADLQFKMSMLVWKEKLQTLEPAPSPRARAAFELCKGDFMSVDPETGVGIVNNNVFVMSKFVK